MHRQPTAERGINYLATKRIVCLANSRKLHGRCIAGRELTADNTPGPWIRPVSNREHQEVSEYERQYRDGSDPKLLDIVDVPLLRQCPEEYQRENWLLDPKFYWQRVAMLPWQRLRPFSEAKGSLWRNGFHSYSGSNDRIPLQDAAAETSSLKLIRVAAVRLRVFAPGEAFGNSKRRVQAAFRFDGVPYALWITDPVIERRYLALDDGHYDFPESYLTVSLGEPFGDYCYKLIAAVMVRP